jgi:hypothetical protein
MYGMVWKVKDDRDNQPGRLPPHFFCRNARNTKKKRTKAARVYDRIHHSGQMPS